MPQGVDDLTAERTEIIVRRINLRGLEMPREQVRHLGRVRLGLFFLKTGQAVNEPVRIPTFEGFGGNLVKHVEGIFLVHSFRVSDRSGSPMISSILRPTCTPCRMVQ